MCKTNESSRQKRREQRRKRWTIRMMGSYFPLKRVTKQRSGVGERSESRRNTTSGDEVAKTAVDENSFFTRVGSAKPLLLIKRDALP
ncbi:hypothetical protein CEXT_666501 [Caerostris extrusa]|uniref:Uncharacterized protein n=1 Tax=Caerostris extrusa TaxID=172846 RepID=A0AAV4UTU2_CAEEX|nr:hypothetical protein CEXT_666501 [Caerostris extrusa]